MRSTVKITKLSKPQTRLPAVAAGVLYGLRRQYGVGMVEVLVAIVIVAFALLGMAGLQASSLRYQKTAHMRGIATQFAAEMADRIRANLAGSANYLTPAGAAYADGPGANPGACGDPAKCTPAEIAARDLYEWRLSLSQRVAGGWGSIAPPDNLPVVIDPVSGLPTNTVYSVNVYFRDPSKRDSDLVLDANCTGLAPGDTDVRCMSTMVTL